MVRRCLEVIRTSHVDLKTVEKLMGSINDLSQMSRTVNFHKREGNLLLSRFRGDYNIVRMVPTDLKEELKVIAKIAESAKTGLPLAEEQCQPSLSCLVFYTDARVSPGVMGLEYSTTTKTRGWLVLVEKAFRTSGVGVGCPGQ